MICPPPPLCRCGCGKPTTFSKYKHKNIEAGSYRTFRSGHNARGRKRPPEEIAKWIRRGSDHWNFGRKTSVESRAKMSAAQIKRYENSPRKYDGGFPNQRDRWSPEYRAWRKTVYHRDNHTCCECSKRGGSLIAHHIKPWAKYPELRFVVDNGLTLCVGCHKNTHASKRKKVSNGKL